MKLSSLMLLFSFFEYKAKVGKLDNNYPTAPTPDSIPQYEQKLTLHRLRVHRHLPQAHHLRSRCLTESSSYRYRLELSECVYIQA